MAKIGKKSDSFASSASVSYQHASGSVDEILRPTLIVSGGRSYRKLTDVQFGRKAGDDREERRRPREDRVVVTQEVYTDDVYDEGEDVEADLDGIKKLPNGNYRLKLPVSPVFFKYIIGKEGRTKKGIERDTECRLWLPPKGREGDVVIEGASQSSVADAKRRVDILVWTNRTRELPTHFISIPLTQPHIKEMVAEFSTAVLESCRRDRGIVSDVFQLPEKFHLTLGVLRLFNPEEKEKAKEVVKEAITAAVPLLGSDPVVICLEGVECMKDDPASVDILFAKVFLTDHSDRLQTFVDAIASYVIENAPDLMSKEFDREGVKLHATLMNSKFPVKRAEKAAEREGKKGGDWRRKAPEPERRKRPEKVSFDATRIFKEFEEFDFGQVTLETLHLSKMGEYGSDGFYQCTQSYPLADCQPP